MQEFRPSPPYKQFQSAHMTEGLQDFEQDSPPDTPSPGFIATRKLQVMTVEQLAAISGQSQEDTAAQLARVANLYPTTTTETLGMRTGKLANTPAPPSLMSALQSTMSVDTTTRMVVIPGSRKNKQHKNRDTAPRRRMGTRLRHSIILAAIVGVLITTFVTLIPLDNGNSRASLLSGFGGWIQGLPNDWQGPSHVEPVITNNPPANNAPPANLPKSQYVAIARQDAIDAGISPDYFTRQINQESGFNPNAVSPAGAVGIAQFLPSTAASLGINPWDPVDALRGAARLMASYNRQYGGDYAKALAAYNAGGGTVQVAVNNCGANWMNCIPRETRNYIYVIMGI